MLHHRGKTLALLLCLFLCFQPMQAAAATDEKNETTAETGNTGDTGDTEETGGTAETDNTEETGDTGDTGSEDEPSTPTPTPVWTNKTVHTTLYSKTRLILSWKPAEYAVKYNVYYYYDGEYLLLDTVKKTTFTDKDIAMGYTHRYKIQPVNADGKTGKSITVKVTPRTIVKIKSQKYSYSTMKDDCKELEKLYFDYCRVSSIGSTLRGRSLYDVCIGNPRAKRSLLVICTLHAREYACSVLAMRQIEYYLQNYNKKIGGVRPSDALKNLQIHYIVMANPDGVMISQTRHPRWKANARGVDLNRNYPYRFRKSGRSGAEGFTGCKAGSERETKAIMKLISSLKSRGSLKAVINYHAMGQIVFGDYDGKDKKIRQETNALYWMARNLTGYKSAASYGGSGRGNLREYLLYVQKIPNITLEIGHTWAPCAYVEYNSIFHKNKMVVLKAANYYRK